MLRLANFARLFLSLVLSVAATCLPLAAQEASVLPLSSWEMPETVFREFPVELRDGQAKGLRSTLEGLTIDAQASQASLQSDSLEAPIAFASLGARWQASASQGGEVEIRVRGSQDDRIWTEWQTLRVNGDMSGGDSDTFFASLIHFGRGTRFIQYIVHLRRVSPGISPMLKDLTFFLIDPGETPKVILEQIEQMRSVSAEAVSKPPVVSRTAWGCPEGQSSPRWPPAYTTVTHLIVHHTDTTNSATDWPAEVRSIWAYHANASGNNWGDIGYNYLIDPNGTVYEGRAGGDNVIGAHFSCVNTNTMGVALLGTYSSTSPTQSARSNLEKLLAWKADQRGINPLQTSYHPPSQLTLYNISGHRDANSSPAPTACPSGTVCPGNTLYNLLPSIRTNVNTLITGGSKPDLVVLSLSGPSTGTIGSTIDVTSQAANTGSADATSSFRMGFYLSTNSTITTSDTLIQTCNFPTGLPAGYGGTCQGPMPIPSSMSPGTYYLGAFVDDQAQISETSDSNNTRVADSGTITLTQSTKTLSVSVSGSGSVVSSPAGINCPSSCSASFATDSTVSLSATPASGWSFAGWGGACSGLGNPCSVTMSSAKSVSATFTQVASYTLTVSGSGTGQGTVTGSGINCTINNGGTSGTCQASYPSGTNVTLTATPASGSTFSGWSGSCSGTGTCSVTMSSNRSVTAGFSLQGSGDVQLTNGVPYSGNLPPGATESVWKYFYFDIPAGPTNLVVTLDNLSEDADLYVRFNAKPDLSNYACRPYIGGTSTEVCTLPSAGAGRWWVGVVNFTSQTSIAFRVTAAWGNSSSGDFFTLAPCRVLDTRNGSNIPLTGGTTYEVGIAELCGVPVTAKSVSANITVVDATAGGYLVFWPAQTSMPNTSNISFAAGQARANNTILLTAPGYYGSPAAVWLKPALNASGTVHVILDVNGYFQ
jgi:hypothetical protein